MLPGQAAERKLLKHVDGPPPPTLMVQKSGKLTSWGWSFFPCFTRFYTSQVFFLDFWTINSIPLPFGYFSFLVLFFQEPWWIQYILMLWKVTCSSWISICWYSLAWIWWIFNVDFCWTSFSKGTKTPACFEANLSRTQIHNIMMWSSESSAAHRQGYGGPPNHVPYEGL